MNPLILARGVSCHERTSDAGVEMGECPGREGGLMVEDLLNEG